MIWGWFLIIFLVVGYLALVLTIIILSKYDYNSPTITNVKQNRDYYLLPPHWSKYPFWTMYGQIKPTIVDRTGRFDLTLQPEHDIYYLTYSIEHDSLILKLKGPMEQLPGAFEWYAEATVNIMIGQLYYYPNTGEDRKLVVCEKGRLVLSAPPTKSKPVYLIKLKEYVYITDSDFIPLSLLQFPLINYVGNIVKWSQIWNPMLYQAQYRASVGLTMIIKENGKSVTLLDREFGRLDPNTYRTSIPWFYNPNPWKLSPVSVPDGTYFFVSNQRDTLILSPRSSLTSQLTLDGLASIDINTCLNNSDTISNWLNSALIIVNNRIFIGPQSGGPLQPRPLGTSSEGIVSIISLDDISKGYKLQIQIFQDEQGHIVLADSNRNPMLLPQTTTFDQIDRTIPTSIPIGWYNPMNDIPIRGYLYQLTRSNNLLNRSMDEILRRIWT